MLGNFLSQLNDHLRIPSHTVASCHDFVDRFRQMEQELSKKGGEVREGGE